MEEFIALQKAIYPDLLHKMKDRYTVLYTIYLFQPIGRRGVTVHTQFPERLIRNEIDVLAELGLVDITTKGMRITNEGENIVKRLQPFIRELSGLTVLEDELKRKTGIKQIIIVPGDSDQDAFVKQELGRATVQFLKTFITEDVTIAVTGGTTMAAVARAMVPFEDVTCLFVPARGGVGEEVENQANTIVAEMAKAERGNYRLLHVPDPLSEPLYQSMVKEPLIMETLEVIKNASIVLHGVGQALPMAEKRKASFEVMNKLEKKHAVSEAFGYYFDEKGNIIHKVRTIGIQLDDLAGINHVITVAGGKSKAQAIASFIKQKKSKVLITDEAAARKIVSYKHIC